MDNTTTTNNVTTADDAANGVKRLHTLIESGEVQGYIKRLAEIRKRVEKLYASERLQTVRVRVRARAFGTRGASTHSRRAGGATRGERARARSRCR